MATDITKCQGNYGELTVSITLTKKGVESYQAVLKLLEDFIRNLSKVEPQEYFYKELKIMAETIYDTVAPSSAVSAAKQKS
jgi:secreted Zn-dependent insulinase-like peptidase